MKHTKTLLAIKLSDLVPSHFNVRRYGLGQVEELAALIDSQGLLQPLIVTEHTSTSGIHQRDSKGKSQKLRFAVAAGERRRRALLLLQQRGRLPKTHEVLCELIAPERAREVSLAENSGRLAMHPADEFEAFQALIAEGKGVEDIAARFGVSVLTVQRRLKLAGISPKLLALYREDGINLDALMALALTDDHAAQERAWFEAQPWDRNPTAIRRLLTAGEVLARGDTLVRFVGLEAYEAAGGVVRRDLFDSDLSRYLSDPALLRRLALEKLEIEVAAVRAEGWAWAEARVEFDGPAMRQLGRCEPELREPTVEEASALAEMKLREAELDAEGQAMATNESWTTEEAERIDLEEQDIAARRTAILIARRTWTVQDKAHAGVVVTVSRQGDLEVLRGLVRAVDCKAMQAAAQRAANAERIASKTAAAASEMTSASIATAGPLPSKKLACSAALTRRLTAHQSLALQAALLGNVPVALAALTHAMLLQVFEPSGRAQCSPVQVSLRLTKDELRRQADDLAASKAWQAMEASELAVRTRLPEDSSEWLASLCALPLAELLELLAFCAAVTVNTVSSTHHKQGGARELAAAVRLDMADWWEPTATGYLAQVSKAEIIQTLQEADPTGNLDSALNLKKDALVAMAASRLAGKRWLPELLRLGLTG